MGLALGATAILCWSFGAAFTCTGAPVLGTWRFVGLTTLVGGLLQIAFRWIRWRELRGVLVLPSALWLITIFGFVVNVMAYPLALTTAQTDAQRCAVNLINYLWPILTVICGILWVRGTRFRWTLALAIALAVAGMALANLDQIKMLFMETRSRHSTWQFRDALPYLLASVGAVTWALYSSLLARWESWAKDYCTSAVGLVVLGITANLVSWQFEGPVARLTPAAVGATVLCALTTQAAGYLLWELALSRESVKILGLIGAMTPILSTIWLCVSLHYLPGVELILAAVLVSGAVVIGMRS